MDRTKQLQSFIESLGTDKRWEQLELLQEIRNKQRANSYESRMGSESLKKRAIALGVIHA